MNVDLTGALTIAWSGDGARDCAAAGQCGVSGSLEMVPSGENSGSPGAPLELADSGAVARVTQRGPTGAVQSTCVDVVPVDLTLFVRHVAGELRALTEDAFQPPSSGRCAGPTGADLSSFSLPARSIGAHGYDLSGQTTFGAGPFTVTVISSLRAHITVTTSGPGFAGPIPVPGPKVRIRHRLEESARFAYRINAVSGTLTTSFSGLPAPLCQPLGACGATGRLTAAFTAGGVIAFSGSRTVSRRVGSAAALADLRAGRMSLGDDFELVRIGEIASETLEGGDGVTCTDQAQEAIAGQSRGRRGADQLMLVPASGPFGGPDPERTRCPGPSQQDVFGDGSPVIARGIVGAAQLGAPRLTVTLSGDGAFTGSAYAGQRSGSVVLDLALVRATGGTRRVKSFSFAGVSAP